MAHLLALKPTLQRICTVCFCLAVLVGYTPTGRAETHKSRGGAHVATSNPVVYRTQLFGKTYRLDERAGLTAYIQALDAAMQRSKDHEPLEEAHKEDPLHNKLPSNFISKKMRRAMKETYKVALQVQEATAEERVTLLQELYVMAGAIRASFLRILPPNMDVFTAIRIQGRLRHPAVGLGKAGPASNLSGSSSDPSDTDPVMPSSHWKRSANIGADELYYGFGRKSLPDLSEILFTYHRSKQSRGGHAGFDVKGEGFGKAKLKFGEEYSQPFAHRIFWVLGFNTIPVDCVPVVKVKWDRRIFTEFNTRKNERLTVNFLGIPVYSKRLQPYLDPLAPVSEIVMLDEQGREITLRPDPTWEGFKQKLYKNPRGRPEQSDGNFNAPFADRIRYLVYRNVNFRSEDEDSEDKGIYLGNWDWNGEGNPDLRETRGFAFISAWINQFDSWFQNNKLYMIENKGTREFRHYVVDLGGSLGSARDASKMEPQAPNDFPWSFTRPARPRETCIPLNGSFHNIQENATLKNADIYDARWAAKLIAQLTGKQILEALVASGLPSAQVRLYYNKLVTRRNKALTDLGLDYPAIPPMDAGETFDYDPQRDGLISIVTGRNERVTAPDDDWIVVKGRCYTRAEVRDDAVARNVYNSPLSRRGRLPAEYR